MRNHRQRLTPLDYAAAVFGWLAFCAGCTVAAVAIFRIIADKVM